MLFVTTTNKEILDWLRGECKEEYGQRDIRKNAKYL